MLFPIPEPDFWSDPGPVPVSQFLHRLAVRLKENLSETRPQWLDQYRAYYERLQRDDEEWARYLDALAAHEALLVAYEEEGEHIADRLPFYLHKLKLSRVRTVQDRRHEGQFFERVIYCQILEWYFDEHAYYFRIDTYDLPGGLCIDDFLDPKIAKTLSTNLNAAVTVEHAIGQVERPGLWIVVEHRAGRGIIPRFVDYSQMFKALPKTAPPLVFPIGVGVNGKAYFADMDEMITVLIAGSRGAGKSNTINTILCTWLQRVPPQQLRLFLTDLKGGLEFDDYAGIPHLGGDVDLKMRLDPDSPAQSVRLGQDIATDPHHVIPILRYMEAEMARRQRIMRGKARKIAAYNRKYKSKLSHWVLVVDELATLMDSAQAKDARSSLAELARKGRAVGIYIILATQIPDKTVLHRQVAGNMDCRLVGRVADGASSALAQGDGKWDATYLPSDVPGRMVWRWADKHIIQAPHIPELTIKQVIKAAINGAAQARIDTEELEITQELFTYALEDLGGLCSRGMLFSHFRNRIGKGKIADILKKWEVWTDKDGVLEPVITLNDEEYYLLPSHQTQQGRTPRQLMALTQFVENLEFWIPIIEGTRKSRQAQSPQPDKNSEMVTGNNSENEQPRLPELAKNAPTPNGKERVRRIDDPADLVFDPPGQSDIDSYHMDIVLGGRQQETWQKIKDALDTNDDTQAMEIILEKMET